MNVNMINLNIMTSLGRFTPPTDCLWEVFSPEVLEVWQRAAPPSENVQFRLKVLEACGSYPSDPIRAAELRRFRAIKAAWDTYLFTSFACGMFEGDKGRDLLARLRGSNDDGFRSAMAECMVCWFLAGRMRLPIDPYAPGRNGRNLEMRVHVNGTWINVEVKAPFREIPKPPPGKSAVSWSGDDADKIDQCMEAANKQFDDDAPNLLVIVPRLRMRVFSHRQDVVKAAFGQSKITWPINTRTGEATGSKVRRLHLSAGNSMWIEHDVVVLHNPHAYHALSQETWRDFPQLVPVDEEMKWTDGYKVDV